ncbi:MAG TPA: hypothetical protein V6C84_18850 [Coleofasciculaceae cyanobacterium]|jgi:hypothetical protein
MTLLTQTQIDKIQVLAGYSAYPILVVQQLAGPYVQVAVDRVDAIILELADIDTQLRDLRPDSLAIEVQGMKLNFNQQRAILKQDGSQLLKELAQLMAISIVYNKYASSSACQSPHYW